MSFSVVGKESLFSVLVDVETLRPWLVSPPYRGFSPCLYISTHDTRSLIRTSQSVPYHLHSVCCRTVLDMYGILWPEAFQTARRRDLTEETRQRQGAEVENAPSRPDEAELVTRIWAGIDADGDDEKE